MSKNLSAGILLYRFKSTGLEILLVHPGGPYFRNKDTGAWTVPKGLFEEGEEPLQAAVREFEEELGQPLLASQFTELTPVKQKGGKTVMVWAAEGDIDTSTVRSNTFKMEYPYKSGKWIEVPEIDRAEWFPPQEALKKINPAQADLITELMQKVNG